MMTGSVLRERQNTGQPQLVSVQEAFGGLLHSATTSPGKNPQGYATILRRALPLRREEENRQEVRRLVEAIGKPCKLEILADLREHHGKSGRQFSSVGYRLTTRNSLLERD